MTLLAPSLSGSMRWASFAWLFWSLPTYSSSYTKLNFTLFLPPAMAHSIFHPQVSFPSYVSD